MISKCCLVGRTRAAESARFACKLDARSALASTGASVLSIDSILKNNPNFNEQCELMLESCCMAEHRSRNCDAGKALAKSGAACMDVELSKEALHATESFNDCCLACSLGVLAARQPSANETITSQQSTHNSHNVLANRCKLATPLDSSFAGLLYERTYVECCEQALPRPPLSSLIEFKDGKDSIDCNQPNTCTQKCVHGSAGEQPVRLGRRFEFNLPAANRNKQPAADHCDCFAGYKLAADGFNCVDVDECSLETHTCNRETEVCDNTRGGFRCLARRQSKPSSSHMKQGNPWLLF